MQVSKNRNRTEANPAPFFMDTGKFPSDQSTYLGWEIYYTSGPLMVGSEWFWHKFRSPQKLDPVVDGGEVVATCLFNGVSRPYTTAGGNIYGFVPVKKSVFNGGPGTWEAGMRYSIFTMNGGAVQAGKFWRITPTVNWYLADYLRLELSYGYGILDRFNLKGATQFFQSRIAFTLR